MKYKEIRKRLMVTLLVGSCVLTSMPIYASEGEAYVGESTCSESSGMESDKTESNETESSGRQPAETKSSDSEKTSDSGETPTDNSSSESGSDSSEEDSETNNSPTEPLGENSETNNSPTESEGESDQNTEEFSQSNEETQDELIDSSRDTNLEINAEVSVDDVENTDTAPQNNSNSENVMESCEGGALSTGEDADISSKINDEYEYYYVNAAAEPNFTNTIKSFSTSVSSTGRYNANFEISEYDNNTQETRVYHFTISGFASEAAAELFARTVQEKRKFSPELGYIVEGDFIDAEKLFIEDYDNNLCWGGTSANMIKMSGWSDAVREKAESLGIVLSDEDDVFNYFRNNFTDDPGNPYVGIGYFFSGINMMHGFEEWAQIKDGKRYSERIFDDYAFQHFTEEIFLNETSKNNVSEMTRALNKLDADEDGDRCALGVVFGYYKLDENGNYVYDEKGNLSRIGGHVVTIVGYSTDENGIPNAIVIADSDDQDIEIRESSPIDSREYKNLLVTIPIKYYDGNWHIMNYSGNKYDNIIDEIISLKYFNEKTEEQKEIYGTKDLINYFDLYGFQQDVYNAQDISCLSAYQDETLYAGFVVNNFSLCNELKSNYIPYRFVISQGDNIIRSIDYSFDVTGLIKCGMGSFVSGLIMDKDMPLVPGEYSICFYVNPDMVIPEAYYSNNKLYGSIRFTILEVHVIQSQKEKKSRRKSILNMKQGTAKIHVPTGIKINDISDITGISYNPYLFNQGLIPQENLEIMKNIILTPNDYILTKSEDGYLVIEFTEQFINQLPVGTNFFNIIVNGEAQIIAFVVE